MKKPRIVLWDCETMPNIAAVWGKYEQDVLWYEREGYMFCYAYKILGEARTHVVSLPDFKTYKHNPHDDKELISSLRALFEATDVIIAHNGDAFDQKVANGRFLVHGLNPPEPYKQTDTLKIARRNFKLNSNKLDDLGRVLGVGRKERTGGVDLWYDVYHGDKKAIKKMLSYNKQDVNLLERVYMKLRAWDTNSAPINLYIGRPNACRVCGSEKVQAGMKYRATNTNLYQYFRCGDCGANLKSRLPEKGKEKMKYV